MKKSNPTMFGNMPLISYLISIYFILIRKSLRKWAKHQNMDDTELFYQWDEKCLAIGELSTSYLENSWDQGNPELLTIKNLHMHWKYLNHLVREAQESSIPENTFSILLPDQFCNLTWKEFMTWRLGNSNQNTRSISSTRYQGQPKQDSGHESY